jgi:hypothetical protein
MIKSVSSYTVKGGDDGHMADYQDFEPPPTWSPANIYRRIQNLLNVAYSVEVLSFGTGVLLRVWFEEHCNPELHDKIS